MSFVSPVAGRNTMRPQAPPATPPTRASLEPVPATWQDAYKSLHQEVSGPQPLRILAGSIPPALTGTLYRNGPGCLEVQGKRLDDWFDGDGMVHALTLRHGQAWYCNRYVRTEDRALEQRAGRQLFAGFSGTPYAGFVGSLLGWGRRNPSNTNVLHHGGRLLSMSESGWPYALDPLTLATLRKDSLGGALHGDETFSAHPKRCPGSGDVYNFGVHPRLGTNGLRSSLHLLRLGADGGVQRVHDAVPLPINAVLHDFSVTQRYAVVLMPPLTIPKWPLGLMAGVTSASNTLRWQPEIGTQILVLDLQNQASPRWLRTDAFFCMHTINAWELGDDLYVDALTYPDASVLHTSKALLRGEACANPIAEIRRLRLGSDGSVQSRILGRDAIELPQLVDAGRPTAAFYCVRGDLRRPMAASVARMQLRSDGVVASQAPHEEGVFYGEGVPVSTQGGEYLLTLAANTHSGRTELRILDGHKLQQGPLCRLELPHMVPMGLHGSWHWG